jgi:hypothetical protein
VIPVKHPAAKAKGFYFIVERLEPELTFSWRSGTSAQWDETLTRLKLSLEGDFLLSISPEKVQLG